MGFLEENYETLDHQTFEIDEVKVEDGVYTLIAYDTPGLNDSTGRGEEYVANIQAKCRNMDVFLYCIKSPSTRVSENT